VVEKGCFGICVLGFRIDYTAWSDILDAFGGILFLCRCIILRWWDGR
jgi:hypothetical protein